MGTSKLYEIETVDAIGHDYYNRIEHKGKSTLRNAMISEVKALAEDGFHCGWLRYRLAGKAWCYYDASAVTGLHHVGYDVMLTQHYGDAAKKIAEYFE